MRDLLYLSESKMRVLTPQLRGYGRRLGIEAGINAGVVSLKGIQPGSEGNAQPSSVEALGAVIEMVEKSSDVRLRTDPDLRPGDWIKIAEDFNLWLARDGGDESVGADGLVYFAATASPPVVLLASAKHMLEQPQEVPPTENPMHRGAVVYMDILVRQARRLLVDDWVPDSFEYGWVLDAAREICVYAPERARFEGRQPIRLAGHARVLGVGRSIRRGEHCVIATPLYLEYAPR
ncbi:SAVMC3_10250 family protein [Streptomyces sp. NPDC059928]|uniref:SAVMC3_10250 family protein n=1 Tax=unclassified Streptomyces TaxID=2593676 RepID=UPI00365CE4A4